MIDSASNEASDIYSFTTEKQQQLFYKVTQELRCAVCQNQTLSDSMAPLAITLKNQIYAKVQANSSEKEIMQYMTSRYGEFISYRPPFEGGTILLWFGPLLFLSLAIAVFTRYIRR